MNALVIVRTPFQAWLVEKVLEKENIDVFDILYFTQNDSTEDKYYYNKLSSKSRKSDYIFVRPQRFDILSSFMFRVKSRLWYGMSVYDTVICASIDALFISSLVRAYSKSKLITLDDGTANININSCYFLESNSKKVLIYRYLFNALPLKDLKLRIDKHYTLYKGQKNIVNSERLVYLDGWTNNISRDKSKSKVYFLGAPFETVMSKEQIDRFEKYVSELKVDTYVAHPRERKLLEIGAKLLDKKGRIAEEAIIADAQDASITLVGIFSTVMLNIGDICESRIVLLPKDSLQTPELFELSKKAGCTPILI